MNRVLALVLAGGEGKRLSVLAHERAKPAVPFAGKYRIIDFTLSNCVNSGINSVAVIPQYNPRSLALHIGVGKPWDLDRVVGGVTMLYPFVGTDGEMHWYSGTAEAVYHNLSFIRSRRIDEVLILSGDHVYTMHYEEMLEVHHQQRADITVGVTEVPWSEANRFGKLALDNTNRVTAFEEQPAQTKSNLASMGIYVFSKKVLAERVIEDAGDQTSRHDFGYSLLPEMVKRDRVFAYRFEGYWQDIGTVEAYYDANMELTKEQPCFSLNSATPVMTQEQLLSRPCISGQASIINSLVSPGCVVKGHVENSVLSPQVWVDEQAMVRNSVIMGRTFIGRHSVVDRCVLDEGVKISDYCYLGFGSSLIPGDCDITVLGKGVTVPPHTAIGRKCKIMPYVETSDFVSNVVTSDSVLSKRSPISSRAKKVAVGES